MRAATGQGAVAWWSAGLLAIAAASISAMALTAPAMATASDGFGPLGGPGGCLAAPGSADAGGCGEGKALIGPSSVAVSPDGANVYVASGTVGGTVATGFGSLAILKREPSTGAISEVGCWSSDGTDGRDGASGACTPTPSLLGADGVAVSPNGLTVFVSSSYSGSVVAFARNPADGSLKRLGCFQARPVGGTPCPFANVFAGSGAMVTSADGRSLYIASPTLGSVSTLSAGMIEPLPSSSSTTSSSTGSSTATSTTGSSTVSAPEPTLASIFGGPASQVLGNPCIAVNGFDGACGVGIAMQGLDSLTLSPDAKQLYAAAPGSNAIDAFTIGAAGALTESSCLKVDPPPGLCSSTKLMASPTQLAISPDGHNVYAADSSEGGGKVDVFDRDASSGALSESSCVDFLAPEKPPEGKEGSEEEPEEKHEPAPSDACAKVPGLAGVDALAVSGDGSEVYAIGSDSAVIFARNPSTGALSEISCADSEDSRCTSVPSLSGVDEAAVSPDGREVYVTAKDSNSVMVFEVGAAVTTGQASATSAGLARISVACPRGLSRACAGQVNLVRSLAARSADGRRRGRVVRVRAGRSGAFAIRPGAHATVAVRLSRSTLRLLLAHRRLRLMAVVAAKPLAGGSGYGRAITFSLTR
jgi:DNA-binding beta-propeller fold protein YncE